MTNFDATDFEATIESWGSEQTKQYVLVFVQNAIQTHDPSLLQEAMDDLRFPGNTLNPHAWTTTYCAEVVERFDII